MNESWWADSMECYTYLRNVPDSISDGKTPNERRFGQKAPIIPFGSLVEHHSLTAKDQSRIHQFGKKVFPGLFLGYAMYAEWIWKGDVLVADLEELEAMDASEIYSKRLNAKEVILPEEKGNFFQSQMDESNSLEEMKTWEHPPRYGSDQFKEKVILIFLENQKGLFHHLTTRFRMPVKRWMIFWSMSGNFMYRHHVEPRVKLYSPREESFPIPLKIQLTYPWTTHTNLDVKQEKRFDDYWNNRWVSRLGWSLDRFHRIYSIGRKISN